MWIRGYDRNWKQYKLDKSLNKQEVKDFQKKIALKELDEFITKLANKNGLTKY